MPMKRRRFPRSLTRSEPIGPAPGDIDALYGLEPVFEPGHQRDEACGTPATFHEVQCPYCGECFETAVDASAGASSYIEDCQICCQPIEFETRLDRSGAVAGLAVRRC